MRDGGYPTGAEFDENAPYNQPIIEPRDVEVDIFVSMSLHTKIKVDDYDVYKDWDDDIGYITRIDLSDCNLMKHVKEQVNLPTEGTGEFKDWSIDDIQVFES